jgi:hypothetical protein
VKYEYESKGGISLPPPYNFRNNHRAAIIMFGYTAFQREGAEYFHGKHTGGVRLLSDYIVCGSMPLKVYNCLKAYLWITHLLDQWKKLRKKRIDTPFILIHAHNENWGVLSTYFPNRTAEWGSCCSAEETKSLMEILNHKKLLMLLTNQHHNFTHPKLLSMPRGLD